MSVNDRTERVLDRAARGEADVQEIENCISATRADLDRNLSAIEQRLSTEALINGAVDYLRATPGEFFYNFGDTVKRNPIPTTLLGISLGWLMCSQRNAPANRDIRPVYGDGDWTADADIHGNRTDYDDSSDRSVSTGDTSAMDRVREAMRSTTSSVGDGASRVAGKIRETREHTRDVLQQTRDRALRAGRSAAQQQRRMAESAQDMVQNHPFILGVFAFAAGAAIAASMKRSRFEDEVMGGYRDQALATAQDVARTGLEQGMESAQSAYTEAKGDLKTDSGKETFGDEAALDPQCEFPGQATSATAKNS